VDSLPACEFDLCGKERIKEKRKKRRKKREE